MAGCDQNRCVNNCVAAWAILFEMHNWVSGKSNWTVDSHGSHLHACLSQAMRSWCDDDFLAFLRFWKTISLNIFVFQSNDLGFTTNECTENLCWCLDGFPYHQSHDRPWLPGRVRKATVWYYLHVPARKTTLSHFFGKWTPSVPSNAGFSF